MMTDDMELVREYAARRSELAFETLVARYVNLVYSTALRRLSDPHLAEEVTQAVFIILARKAGSLGPKTILPSWLHRAASFVAADALKIQRRRARREQEAHMQSLLNEPSPGTEDTWPQIAPLLDTAIAGLNEKDRHAIVLRFFQNRSLVEVGRALGANEDAARMRVNRALDKLRGFFSKHGIGSSAAIIAGAISANAVQVAPLGLAKSVTAVAVAKGAAAGSSTLTLVEGALKLMAWAKAKTAIVAGVCLSLAAGTTTVAFYNQEKPARGLPKAGAVLRDDRDQWSSASNQTNGQSAAGESLLASSKGGGNVTSSAMAASTRPDAVLAQPANPLLVIHSISVQGTNVALGAAIPAGLGQVTLEMRPGLDAPWRAAEALDVPAQGGEVVFTVQKPGELQFFRLKAAALLESAGAVSEELSYVPIAPLRPDPAVPGTTKGGATEPEAIFHFKGMVDGSDHILITREGAFWQHAHWDWPPGAVMVNGARWDPRQKNYLTTAGAAQFLPEAFSLEAVSLEVIKARDVVALERTNNALVVHIDDTPEGPGEYEFKIHFHPARAQPARSATAVTASLKIAAQIDGSDCLKITATEATWQHKTWDWPANVALNDVGWSLQQTNVLRNEGTNVFLPPGIDLSTARIIGRKGRDLATMWAGKDALWVWFADNPNGSDWYELELSFGQ